MAELSEAQAFTLKDFIRCYRPDGFAHIIVEGSDGVTKDIPFEEVLCDLCNVEIIQPEDERYKVCVFVIGSCVLCEECRHRIEDGCEEPSLLYKELIVEALSDYRRWFDGDDQADTDKRKAIDHAIRQLESCDGAWRTKSRTANP